MLCDKILFVDFLCFFEKFECVFGIYNEAIFGDVYIYFYEILSDFEILRMLSQKFIYSLLCL